MAFWNMPEEIGKLGVHGLDVLGVEIENFLARFGMLLGIGFDGSAESFQVLVSELVRDLKHAGFDVFDLRETDLVDLFRSQIGGGAFFDAEGVALGTIRERPDSGFSAALRSVFIANEGGELGVRGIDGVTNGGHSGFAQASAV